jgi:hypothetical protein
MIDTRAWRRDEGVPDPRGTDGVYAGYFRDLDGLRSTATVAG